MQAQRLIVETDYQQSELSDYVETKQDVFMQPVVSDSEMDAFMERTAQQIAGIKEAFE